MKKIYFTAVALLALTFSANAQVQMQRQETANFSSSASLRADAEKFSYYKLGENDNFFTIGAESEMTAGALVKIPGEKLKDCTITGVEAGFGFGGIEVTFVAYKELGGKTENILGLGTTLEDTAGKALIAGFGFPNENQITVESSANYYVGYLATFKGSFLTVTDKAKDPLVPEVNFLLAKGDSGLNIGSIDKESWAGNWILGVRFVRSNGVEGVFTNNTLLYAEDGKIVAEGVENYTLQVFNLSGEEVRNENLSTGTYVARLTVDGRTSSFKVVVK